MDQAKGIRVINDGKHITIKATFHDAAMLTEMVRTAEKAYERAGVPEYAEQARQLVDQLTNGQTLIK